MLNSINDIYYLRRQAPGNGRQDDEDDWGFGQAVPMLLFIPPFATVIETAYGTSKMTQSQVDDWLTPLKMHSRSTVTGLRGIPTRFTIQKSRQFQSFPQICQAHRSPRRTRSVVTTTLTLQRHYGFRYRNNFHQDYRSEPSDSANK
jgi:hypothetical protein